MNWIWYFQSWVLKINLRTSFQNMCILELRTRKLPLPCWHFWKTEHHCHNLYNEDCYEVNADVKIKEFKLQAKRFTCRRLCVNLAHGVVWIDQAFYSRMPNSKLQKSRFGKYLCWENYCSFKPPRDPHDTVLQRLWLLIRHHVLWMKD